MSNYPTPQQAYNASLEIRKNGSVTPELWAQLRRPPFEVIWWDDEGLPAYYESELCADNAPCFHRNKRVLPPAEVPSGVVIHAPSSSSLDSTLIHFSFSDSPDYILCIEPLIEEWHEVRDVEGGGAAYYFYQSGK